LVFAFTTAASDAVAIPTRVSVFEFTALVIPAVALLVFALITAANEVDAVKTVASVLLLTALVIPAVAEFVFALITAARDVDAVVTVVPTVVTSDCVASEPESRPAPVKVRVALDHTSAAKVPKVLKVREV
jgi:hypothetical protein